MSEIIKSHSERTLDEWLYYLESIHPSEIDMGLERIAVVAKRLAIDLSFAQVVTVAGTNGKGTTCAFIENALLMEQRSVAVYSSPHITEFNERLRINQKDVADQPLVRAFEQIEQARAEISLTYYEYTTLAALLVLMSVKPEFIILEVGLGGRLDATNIIDANIAVITTIDLDHQAFLGNTREAIGAEKAGILRPQQPAVIGDKQPPASVLSYGEQLSANLYCRGRQFTIEPQQDGNRWRWQSEQVIYELLPRPHIPQDNVATALMVLKLLAIELSNQQVITLIEQTKVAGRTEILVDGCQVMLDVGHNPLAARYLADQVKEVSAKQVHAVVGMLSDKDIVNTIKPLIPYIDHWYLCSLDVARGANAAQLREVFTEQDAKNLLSFDNVSEGYKMAKAHAGKQDLILVFGSFVTVAQVKSLYN
ncbi:bifunctional folylpolyglutamate synthase/dihydrofolate synthase [Thalassotalea insulae]|uniref:Dihydrofolate synthase/folylpolyglutamate synthase n=1 Tax=Thalassotalea insulae TaxID=2056778 RepID=A0ABQ6GQI8_9GAMM|nr:bifunctional tetrahydrofolate synthase/dihydrofolate synthase [Thalassotalea insulae]GLX77439.1 bifunctional folylpolyglutamate synthase/dihydrofolate synthase [Thalassotalea insulae]